MPDQFQCPKCSAAYARERRRVGKAVVCACGHKFLVPPPDYEAPPPATRVRSSDSSAEVLPLAEVVEPATSSGAVPWAEPIGAEPLEELPQAEVVYDDDLYTDAIAPGKDLFSPGGAYGHPLETGPLIRPLPPRSAPRTSPVRKAHHQRRPKRSPRPLGIFLLALPHFLFGAIFMAAALSRGAVLGWVGRHSPASVLVVGAIFASLFIALGVGVLRGVKWVWWLEAFGVAWSISSNAVSVLLAFAVPLIPGLLNPVLGGLSAYFIFKYLTRFVFGSLLLAYLFKENVLAFFGLKRLDTGQALGILFGIAITLTLLLTGIALFLLRARVAPAPSRQAASAPMDRVPIQPAAANIHPKASSPPIKFSEVTNRATSDEFGRVPNSPAAESPEAAFFSARWMIFFAWASAVCRMR